MLSIAYWENLNSFYCQNRKRRPISNILFLCAVAVAREISALTLPGRGIKPAKLDTIGYYLYQNTHYQQRNVNIKNRTENLQDLSSKHLILKLLFY